MRAGSAALGGLGAGGFSATFVAGIALALAGLCIYPAFVTEFDVSNVAFYLLNIPLALGLCLLWGYCGVLSFGQVAYFGIAGYAYGIIAGNLSGQSWGPILGSLGG